MGWVGFDPTNNCSPDERYIRVSCGLDANYAAPIKGVFYGRSNSNGSIEKLKISVQTLEYNSQQYFKWGKTPSVERALYPVIFYQLNKIEQINID